MSAEAIAAGEFALKVLGGPVRPEASEKAHKLLGESLDALLGGKPSKKAAKDAA